MSLFTTDSLGGMSGNEAYEVSDADFVREDDSAPAAVTSEQDAGAESIASDDVAAAVDIDAAGGDES